MRPVSRPVNGKDEKHRGFETANEIVFAHVSFFPLCSLCPLWLKIVFQKKLSHKGHKEHKERTLKGPLFMSYAPIPPEDEELAYQIIGAAIEVHRILGPGFIESIYEKALEHELKLRGIPVERQQKLIVQFKDIRIEGQRLDLLVGGRIIVDLKAVDTVAPIHQAKLLSYLKTTGLRLGLIINFNVTVLKDGVERMVR